MQDEETRATLTRLSRAEARVAELKLRVAAHGEKNKIGDDTGATSTANWWAHTTKTTRAATHRDVKLAKALDDGGARAGTPRTRRRPDLGRPGRGDRPSSRRPP